MNQNAVSENQKGLLFARGKNLRIGFVYALVGNLFYAFCQYGILIILVKKFSPETVGAFVYALAFCTPVFQAVDMQLRNLYIAEGNSAGRFNKYFTFRWFAGGIALAIVLTAAAFIKPGLWLIIAVIGVSKLIEAQLDMIYGVYQKEERQDILVLSRVVRGIVSVVLVFIVATLTQSLFLSLGSYVLSWALMYFVYERRTITQQHYVEKLSLVRLDKKDISGFLKCGAPVILTFLVDSYYFNCPRYFIERHMGLSLLGVFASLMYFKYIGGQIISSLGQVAIPSLAKNFQTGRIDLFKKTLGKLLLVGLGVGLLTVAVSVCWGEQILRLVYNEQYAEHSYVLVLIMAGSTLTFMYGLMGTAFSSMQYQWAKLPIHVVSFAVMIGLLAFQRNPTLESTCINIVGTELLMLVLYGAVLIKKLNSLKQQTHVWTLKPATVEAAS